MGVIIEMPQQVVNEIPYTLTHRTTTRFDWWYMVVMVIYMGMATPDTCRMVQSFSGNPIPLLLPMILTWALYVKHDVNFKNHNYKVVVSIYLVWTIFSLIKWQDFSTSELSYYFFPLYNIIVAYVQVKAFGKDLILLYENVIVFFAKISIVLWILYLLQLPFLDELARMFPETSMGNSIFYLYTWPDSLRISQGGSISATIRNFGCAWEPGRFAIMVVLGIYCNICRNGVRFKGNSNLKWLIATLISTFSTTGFVAAVCLIMFSLIRKFNTKTVLLTIVSIPILYGIYSLDFIGGKIESRLDDSQKIERLDGSFSYHSKIDQRGEYLGSIDRFDAAVFEYMNLQNDALLGYSNNFKHSFFYREISTNYRLANGLVNIFATYGIILGLIIFYWLFKSSIRIGEIYPDIRKFGLVITFVLSAISYKVFTIPVFTAFWFFGMFDSDNG